MLCYHDVNVIPVQWFGLYFFDEGHAAKFEVFRFLSITKGNLRKELGWTKSLKELIENFQNDYVYKHIHQSNPCT